MRIQMAAGIVVAATAVAVCCRSVAVVISYGHVYMQSNKKRNIESLSCAFFSNELVYMRLFVLVFFFLFRYVYSKTQFVGFITISATLIEFVYGFVLEKPKPFFTHIQTRA